MICTRCVWFFYCMCIPCTSKFSRRTIFADYSFQTFRGNNFHGSRVSSIEYSKFRELNFRGLLKSAKTVKIMRRKNLDVYGIDEVRRNIKLECSKNQQAVSYNCKDSPVIHQKILSHPKTTIMDKAPKLWSHNLFLNVKTKEKHFYKDLYGLYIRVHCEQRKSTCMHYAINVEVFVVTIFHGLNF